MATVTKREVHGKSKTKLHRVWRGMKERCLSPKHKSFDRYGGRGITVCAEWMQYSTFHEWAMSNGYKQGLTIDRIDNDAGYSPGNCRFVTHKQNCHNTSRVVHIDAMGETKPAGDWESDERSLVSRRTISRRVAKGMNHDDAITLRGREWLLRFVEAFGEAKTVSEWVEDDRCVVVVNTLRTRLDTGWKPEDAITTPAATAAKKITAWGETKTISEWLRDSRCAVSIETIRRRLDDHGMTPEDAISMSPRTRLGVPNKGDEHVN